MLTPSTTTTVVAAAAVAVGVVAIARARRRRKVPVKLTKDTIKDFMKRIDAIVSDCDGVMWWMGRGVVPNAKEAVEALKAAGKKVLYASNNSVVGPLEKLKRNGHNVKPNEVVHPAMAVAGYLRHINFQKKVFALAVDRFKDELRQNGIRVVDNARPSKHRDESIEGILSGIEMDPEVGAVVLDLDINSTYTDLNVAASYLMKPDCRLYIGATDDMLTFPENIVVLGPGAYQRMLEDLTGKKGVVLGKPRPAMVLHFLKDEHNLDLKRTVFVGDTLLQDMGVAHACGMVKLLVLTGVSQLADVATCPPELIPDYYIDSFGDLLALVKEC